MITEIACRGNAKNVCTLPLSVDGMTITVGAGSFKLMGEDYQLDEETVFTAESDAALVTQIAGYLVKDDEGVSVLVDEALWEDPMFEFEGTGIKKLHRLFYGNIPPGATSLDEAELRVFPITEPLPPEPPPEPPAPVEPEGDPWAYHGAPKPEGE